MFGVRLNYFNTSCVTVKPVNNSNRSKNLQFQYTLCYCQTQVKSSFAKNRTGADDKNFVVFFLYGSGRYDKIHIIR